MNRAILSLLFWLTACAHPALALDLFVDASTGNDTNDGLSWASPKATIGAALAEAGASAGPDIVNVAEGIQAELLVMPPETTLRGGFARGGASRDTTLHATILDGRGSGPVIRLGPGTDACVVDGLTIRGGWTDTPFEAGGVVISGATPLILGCVIEENEGMDAGGISVSISAGPLPRIEGCLLTRNRASRQGAALLVNSPPSALAASVPVLIDSIIAANAGTPMDRALAGAVMLCGSALVESVLFRDNIGDGLSMGCSGQPGQPLSARLQRALNCEFSGNTVAGASLQCSGDEASFENCTFSGNGVTPIQSNFCGFGIWNATVRRSIAWPEGLRDGLFPGCTCFVSNSISAGGWRGQADVLDLDPLFAAGPGGDYYLGQLAAGQPSESAAVDLGSITAASVGLDVRATRTDSVPDVGMVDLGVHYRPFGMLTLLRSQVPTALAPIRTMPGLPILDDPGVLSDSSLPLLYYAVEAVNNDIHVKKDLAGDTLRLSF